MLGLGLGLHRLSEVKGLVSLFRKRVFEDGGTFEAQSCVSAELNRVKGI